MKAQRSHAHREKINFPKAKLIPLIIRLGDFLKTGFDHYVELKAAGCEADPDIVAAFIGMQMGGWNPKLKGRDLLDPDTKEAAARFLAGVALNIAENRDA